MGNRADRRASAKIARQAMKRAKSPTESGILRAAAAFAGDGAAGQLGPHLARADFDDAWARLAHDLHDVLEDQYPAFLAQAYAEAGLGTLRVAGPNGVEAGIGTRLFLCPVSGSGERLAAFAGDAREVGRLEGSLREFGLVPETGGCVVLPLVLSIAAFAPQATAPGRVHALHGYLAERLGERLSGAAAPSREAVRDSASAFCELLPDAAGGEVAFGAMVGIELVPDPPAAVAFEDEAEAEAMARAAAAASWHDSYAADIEGLTIEAPLDWPACAAALAWETVRVPMQAALRRRGVPDAAPEIVHCGPSADGERLVVSAVHGDVAVGPFRAASDLVWFDPDEFFGRAEASAGTLMEHDGERPVLAPLAGNG